MGKVDLKKLFGTSVKARRSLLRISQEELAERANLHRTYICDIERGARNVSLESIEKLAQALEISVATLFPQPELRNGKTTAANGNGHGKNFVDVLLVEDNADDVTLTLDAFKRSRFTNRVHVVADGAAALDYIFCRGKYAQRNSKENPQIILLDLNLPKVSGLEVLQRIKADKRTRKIPVIVLTVSQKDRDIAECRRLGAETYIVKPVDFQGLSQATPQLNLNWALLKPPEEKSRNPHASLSV